MVIISFELFALADKETSCIHQFHLYASFTGRFISGNEPNRCGGRENTVMTITEIEVVAWHLSPRHPTIFTEGHTIVLPYNQHFNCMNILLPSIAVWFWFFCFLSYCLLFIRLQLGDMEPCGGSSRQALHVNVLNLDFVFRYN